MSADNLIGKYSGRLFQYVLDKHQLQAAQLVHIGDNPISDRKAACQQGIQGIWLFEKGDLKRREQLTLSATMAKRGGIWTGRHFFSLVQARIQQRDGLRPHNFFYRYGRDVLGAAFSVFMLGLQERLQRQAIEKVLFVARDGYLFERM